VAGHVPKSVTAEEASRAGQRSIEHFTGLDAAKTDRRQARVLSAILKRNHTWLCPTLTMRRNYGLLDDARLVGDPRLMYAKPSWRQRWARMSEEARAFPADELPKRRALVKSEERLVGEMKQAGVGILAGTDDGNPYCIPGFSLHDE